MQELDELAEECLAELADAEIDADSDSDSESEAAAPFNAWHEPLVPDCPLSVELFIVAFLDIQACHAPRRHC